MQFESLHLKLTPLAGAVPAWQSVCDAAQVRGICEAAAQSGGRLISLWATDRRAEERGLALDIVLADANGLLWLQSATGSGSVPDLTDLFPAAGRLQRAARDLCGLPFDGPDQRPWIRHGAWPADRFPLQRDFAADSSATSSPEDYAFVRVEGDGVHEIPVGPVHAGTIEPGHFRFSILGEEVLRLEQRLGYTHKGIEKRFESMTLAEGAALAGRVSGDSTVAYAWAYAMAAEGLLEVSPPVRALWLRALMLERERLANHLGDLGALGNDGGFAFGLSHFMRLKELVARLNARLFGHRFMMDAIVPGGVACDVDRPGLELLAAQCDELEREVTVLKHIYDDHAGLQDRLMACGVVTPELASRLGVSGLAGRASGQPWDMRSEPGLAPYDILDLRVALRTQGDVAARAAIRFDEIGESLRLVRAIVERIAPGPVLGGLPAPIDGAQGLGWVEGWRGDVLVALEAGASGRIRRCHPHDPSWQNWPALEHAIIGNIVPDFPLINKSFNLSYAGHDL